MTLKLCFPHKYASVAVLSYSTGYFEAQVLRAAAAAAADYSWKNDEQQHEQQGKWGRGKTLKLTFLDENISIIHFLYS